VELALGILFFWLGGVALVVAFQGYRNLSAEGPGRYAGAWDFLSQRVYGPITSQVNAAS
jgi:hypothetical protein